MADPLRAVTGRWKSKGLNGGLWDHLTCGPRVPFDGVKHLSRRCRECSQQEPVNQAGLPLEAPEESHHG